MEETEKKSFWSKLKTFFNSKKTLTAIASTSLGVLITCAIAGGGIFNPENKAASSVRDIGYESEIVPWSMEIFASDGTEMGKVHSLSRSSAGEMAISCNGQKIYDDDINNYISSNVVEFGVLSLALNINYFASGKVAPPIWVLTLTANDGYCVSVDSINYLMELKARWEEFEQIGTQLILESNISLINPTTLTVSFCLTNFGGTEDECRILCVALDEVIHFITAEPVISFGKLPYVSQEVNVGIYTDGEESAAGGSVQVTYPIKNGDMIESKSETLTSSSTLDVAEPDQDHPFIITPIPNEGYELETFYGDGEVNITDPGQVKDAYNIHFIRSDSKWEGEGSENSPYKISNKPQLARLANVVNNGINFSDTHFEQTSNIRIGGSEWTPIGKDYDHSFQGHYNGNGYKIQGITINSTDSAAYVGLFGEVDDGTIENITLEGGTIRGVADCAGSIAGITVDAQVINCKSNVNITVEGGAGGIIGYASYGDDNAYKTLISDCYYSGNVSASNSDYCGGITGVLSNGIMTNCIFEGVVSGENCYGVGGLVGWTDDGGVKISNCIPKGTIIAFGEEYNVGSLGGAIYGGSSFTNCAAYGYIKTDDPTQTGALIGSAGSTTITACSFSGTCNTDDIVPFVAVDDGGNEITACYVWLNNDIKVYSDDTSNWAEYYGLAGSMNDGLPMQRSLFAIASVSPATTQDILAVFSTDDGWKKFEP